MPGIVRAASVDCICDLPIPPKETIECLGTLVNKLPKVTKSN